MVKCRHVEYSTFMCTYVFMHERLMDAYDLNVNDLIIYCIFEQAAIKLQLLEVGWFHWKIPCYSNDSIR